MIKIAFLGTGLISWAHSLSLKAMIDSGVIDARIVSCYDVDEERSAQFASIHGCDAMHSAEDALGGVDAVWICTPTAQHKPLIEMAAELGIAVFREKPLGRSMAEVGDIADSVRVSGISFQVGLVLRTCPVFVRLKEIVEEGQLGRPMAVSFRDDQFFPIQGHYASTWRGDLEQAGGGTVIEHSIHDLDILQYCFGRVNSIFATTSNFAGHTGIEDVAVANFEFDGGMRAALVSVWHQLLTRPSTRRLEVIFERGIVWLDNDFTGPLHEMTEKGDELVQCPPPTWVSELPLPEGEIGLAIRMYAQQDRNFIDSLVSGEVPSPSIDDAVQAHVMVDAVYSSAATGHPVKL